MIYLINYENAKLFSIITLVLLVVIPLFIYIIYLVGAKKDRRRNKKK